MYAIWDIDNCLADDRHRLHLIDWSKEGDERYATYNAEMLGDPVWHLAEFRLMQRLGCTPVFFTGRPEKFRGETTEWLQQGLGVSRPLIFMRPDGTVGLRPADLKEQMLIPFLNEVGHPSIMAAFDDLPVVIDRYKQYGIRAVLLQISDHQAAYDKADLQEGLPNVIR